MSDKFLANCLGVECPELCLDWHPTKNLPMTITNTSFGSAKRVWWLCHLCSHEWQAYIANRRKQYKYPGQKGTGCPNCLKLSFKKKERPSKDVMTFAQFVLRYLHIKQQMAAELEIAESTIERWANGTANPHPLIKSAVWTYLNEQQMKEDNLTHLRAEKRVAVEDIIRKFDPQGLIKMGAPSDEYASEAQDVTHHLYLSRSFEEFQKALWAIFVCSFSAHSAGDLKSYEAMAKEIWPIKKDKE